MGLPLTGCLSSLGAALAPPSPRWGVLPLRQWRAKQPPRAIWDPPCVSPSSRLPSLLEMQLQECWGGQEGESDDVGR